MVIKGEEVKGPKYQIIERIIKKTSKFLRITVEIRVGYKIVKQRLKSSRSIGECPKGN